jgi:hypothetical protein
MTDESILPLFARHHANAVKKLSYKRHDQEQRALFPRLNTVKASTLDAVRQLRHDRRQLREDFMSELAFEARA